MLQDILLANVENEISQSRLQLSHVTGQLRRLQQTLDEHNAATQEKNVLISKAEAEIAKNNAQIERKQTQVDQFNKKIEQKISKMEGVSVYRIVIVYVHCTLLQCTAFNIFSSTG